MLVLNSALCNASYNDIYIFWISFLQWYFGFACLLEPWSEEFTESSGLSEVGP